MYSFSIDYLFNRVYDVLLWIKYTYLFVIMREDKQIYLDTYAYRTWDGLRDRGWLDMPPVASSTSQTIDTQMSFWEKVAALFGKKLPDSDSDGIPDVNDPSPYDADNLLAAQLKERYQESYSTMDTLRDFFGFGPLDTDSDGVPDSYEKAHNMNSNSADSDHDGLADGRELQLGTDSLNNDTDSDGVLDGRDEAALDHDISSKGLDTDGDGVSDDIETILGSDITKIDTDGDGIPDGMDTYIVDPTNTSVIHSGSLPSVEGLHFAIQNPVLIFIIELYKVAALFGVFMFAYVFFRWYLAFWEAQMHYEHAFPHDDEHAHGDGHIAHTVAHHKENNSDVLPFLPGLAIKEDEGHGNHHIEKLVTPHPKWKIVEGYMKSDHEALWRIGIIEADALLDNTLRERGYQGKDMAEMLKSARFTTIDLAWDAHKVRNRIAHDGAGFVMTEHEAKRVFALYEAVFREMKII